MCTHSHPAPLVDDHQNLEIAMYRIYPKYSDTSTPYHTCSKIWTSAIYYSMLCLKIAEWVANSVDPDESPRSAATHLGLHRLLMPVCTNTYGKHSIPSRDEFKSMLFSFFFFFFFFFFIYITYNLYQDNLSVISCVIHISRIFHVTISWPCFLH